MDAAVDPQAVALKAFTRIADRWSLTEEEAAALVGMPLATWRLVKEGVFEDTLTEEQMLRLSALVGIYKNLELSFDQPVSRIWVTRRNKGPEFGGRRPVDAMVAGGLPATLRVRKYLEALRMGA